MIRNLTCIICPRGCTLTVECGTETARVTGHSCPKGEVYGISECLHPMRTVTATVRVSNRENTMASVKTAAPVPKEKMLDVMAALRKVNIQAPVKIGDTVLQNVFGTDILITKSIM